MVRLSTPAARRILDPRSPVHPGCPRTRLSSLRNPTPSPQASLPSREEGFALYARLRDGDPLASSDLCCAYFPFLIRFLRGCHPEADDDSLHDAVTRTLMDLIDRPTIYDPARTSLQGFLQMAARGDLLNALAAARRRANHQVSFERLTEAGTEIDGGGDPLAIVIVQDDDVAAAARVPPAVRAGLSPAEAAVFTLMAEGERRTETYAHALGLTHLPVSAQRREIKRMKDRIKKRIERAQ